MVPGWWDGWETRRGGISVASLYPATSAFDGTSLVMTDNPTTRLVTLDAGTGKVVATRYVGISPEAGAEEVHLQVPYIQQVNDASSGADGNWACLTVRGHGASLLWRACAVERVPARAIGRLPAFHRDAGAGGGSRIRALYNERVQQ